MSVVGYYYLGRFYLENDQLAEAKKELHRALTLDPKFVPAMFDLGVALEREKQYSRALSLYRRVLRYQPNNSRAWANIGRLLLMMHRYTDGPEGLPEGEGPGEERRPPSTSRSASFTWNRSSPMMPSGSSATC